MRQEKIWYPTLISVDIRSSDINIGASYGQIFVWVIYIHIGPYHTLIGSSYGQVFFWIKDTDIGAYYIDIGAYYIDIRDYYINIGGL